MAKIFTTDNPHWRYFYQVLDSEPARCGRGSDEHTLEYSARLLKAMARVSHLGDLDIDIEGTLEHFKSGVCDCGIISKYKEPNES